MSILDKSLRERALEYADHLIIKPLISNNDFLSNNFSKKELAVIIEDNLEKNKSSQELASNFGHFTKNWNIDWHWIAHHIVWDYHNIKQAQMLLKTFGPSQQVFKSIDKTYSPECLTLYLTNSTNRNSEPKSFTLAELIQNGNNFGKERKNWKPIIGVTDFGFYKNQDETEHYYDNTFIAIKSDWEIWDKDKGCYKAENKPLTERQKKIRKLVKITITDQNGNILSSTKTKNRAENKSASRDKKQFKWWKRIFE